MSLLYLTTLLISTAAIAGSHRDVVTHLEFYFHEIVSGSNPTSYRVAQPVSNYSSSSFYGMVIIADDPLTETADPKSKLVGRAQGVHAFSGQAQLSALMAMGFSFVTGPYKGSTLTIIGKNPSPYLAREVQTVDGKSGVRVMVKSPAPAPAPYPPRELPVVGGTGVFRMARGYAILQTVSLTPEFDSVVYYNVTVYTPA